MFSSSYSLNFLGCFMQKKVILFEDSHLELRRSDVLKLSSRNFIIGN
jgi:hypothetical protein